MNNTIVHRVFLPFRYLVIARLGVRLCVYMCACASLEDLTALGNVYTTCHDAAIPYTWQESSSLNVHVLCSSQAVYVAARTAVCCPGRVTVCTCLVSV